MENIPPLLTAPDVPDRTSIKTKVLKMVFAPGEVFEEVREMTRPRKANWLVPTLLVSLIMAISAIFFAADPAVLDAFREGLAASYAQQVAEGRMSPEAAEKARKELEEFVTLGMAIAAPIGIIVVPFIGLLGISACLMGLSSLLAAEKIPFGKAMEVVGLASVIGAINGIVSILLRVVDGPTTLGLGMFISEFNPQKVSHFWADSLNIMSLWYIGVLSLGLAKLGNIPWRTAALSVFVTWLIAQHALMTYVGIGR